MHSILAVPALTFDCARPRVHVIRDFGLREWPIPLLKIEDLFGFDKLWRCATRSRVSRLDNTSAYDGSHNPKASRL
jgi:hypothetical protein